jgi:glycosyltransferase involved in cell wall biosynthesis
VRRKITAWENASGVLFSVLLPTHDRLDYLQYAVESVRRQDDPGWEIIISDNDSEDDIGAYVEGLGDDRVRYVRTERFVPVTENWNNALRHSTADYIVMLGDDDALLPGYFSALRTVIDSFEEPDAIYLGALLYAYPGVLPDAPDGYLQPNAHAPFFADAEEPFVLDSGIARELVRAAMDFRARYDFNMQYIAVSRELVDELAGDGDFFRSPFPDYYAMNLVFARARAIVVDPKPRVVVGITPRSHGFFHFNRREAEAQALLNTDGLEPAMRRDLERVILPGANINTSWLLAMEALYRRLGSPPDMRPNYARYRMLQAVYCEQAYHLHRTITRAELGIAEAGAPPLQRYALRLLGWIGGTVLRASPPVVRRAIGAAHDRLLGQFGRGETPLREVGRYHDIIEVFDAFAVDAPRAGQRP